jgi:holo-[acyl-carrier protein] synthase
MRDTASVPSRDCCRRASVPSSPAHAIPARFLAKRFAAKEAFGKALGTGLIAPATLPNIGVAHDALGRPLFEYATPLAVHLAQRGLFAHLSISDEQDYAIAFVIMEQT